MTRALLALALAACTGDPDDTGPDDTGGDDTADTSDTDDTGDSDAPTERLGVRGDAVIDLVLGTWVGTTTVYDALVDGDGTIVETRCELHFTSVGEPAETATPCSGCTFAFAVEHVDATGQTGPDCDALWPPSHPGRVPATWDATLGYHPTGAEGAPALVTWIDAWTDNGGTFHPAGWEVTPSTDQPHGGAAWNDTTGAFAFDRPVDLSP